MSLEFYAAYVVAYIVIVRITAMVFAAMSDYAYAISASRACKFLSTKRLRLMKRISGMFLVGGGVWLAFSRTR